MSDSLKRAARRYMRRVRVADAVLILISLGYGATMWIPGRVSRRRERTSQAPPASRPTTGFAVLPVIADESLAASVERIRNHDPFRTLQAPPQATPQLAGTLPLAAGESSAWPFGALQTRTSFNAANGLAVRAVAGPPWVAVLSGVPGRPEHVMAMVNDTLGALRIRAISSGAVVIETRDSVVRLTFPPRSP